LFLSQFSVTCGHGSARLHVFKQKFRFFRLFLPENDFQMVRKLIPRHKNARPQLKARNSTRQNFRLQNRACLHLRQEGLRTVGQQLSFFLEGTKRLLKKILRWILWTKFTILSALFISVYRRLTPKISNFLKFDSKLARLVRIFWLFLHFKRMPSLVDKLFWLKP